MMEDLLCQDKRHISVSGQAERARTRGDTENKRVIDGRRKKRKKTRWEEQRTNPELGEQTPRLLGLTKSGPGTNGEVRSEHSKKLRVPLPYVYYKAVG